MEKLLEVDEDMSNEGIKGDWKKDLKPEYISKRKNWWIGFIPNSWGIFKNGWYGVHFGFMYHRNRNTSAEYVRFNVSIEKPLKTEFHDQFKKDVVEHLKKRKVDLKGYAIWPDVGFRKAKLIETTPLIILDNNSWEKVLDKYLELKKRDFVQVVAEVIRHYYDRGCFNTHLDFPE